MPELPQAIRGFGTTFVTQFKKVNTEQYPEEKDQYPPKPRFHGRHQLNRHPDGLEKCIGCELCAWACPADAIFVEGADNTDEERYSPGERYGRVYQINYLRCILCGLCIEACPTRALTMTNEYELADDSREKLIYDKQDLLGPLLPGMAAPPHSMNERLDEVAYYRGEVSGASPTQLLEADERAAHSAEAPAPKESGRKSRRVKARGVKSQRAGRVRRAKAQQPSPGPDDVRAPAVSAQDAERPQTDSTGAAAKRASARGKRG